MRERLNLNDSFYEVKSNILIPARSVVYGIKDGRECSFSCSEFIKMIEEYNGKVLAITGKGDVQADSSALEKLEQFTHVTTYTPEMVNHMLREVDEVSIMKVKKQYKDGIKQPIHEETKETLKKFLKR